MSTSPYDKAIESFEALLTASCSAIHSRPSRLIEDSGLVSTSGYRHTGTLEAEGIVRRDEEGVYLQGTAALEIALSSYGIGRLTPVLPQILRRMREETQHTTFLAILDDAKIHIGPYSTGRATRQIKLAAQYQNDLSCGLPRDELREVNLAPAGPETGLRLSAFVAAIHNRGPVTAALGIMARPDRITSPALKTALLHAVRQIAL